ncbi:SapC family protein [Shewanella sp. Isolate11]|uniref:SapC family protein n=1 Tax=Shewanella sp. Isolate11 TaxID=2908530 RepID=UPI001EFE31D5|nr:SapC family protein [Shewanella sp. Isolate11]MCG9696001.1 SapC family protein [Shewanella sp. Isolate11]
MNDVVILDPAKHGQFKLKPANFSHVAEQHILPISLHEFAAAATDSPIVFVKNSETGEFQPVMILGLEPGQNLKQKEGKWLGSYLPNILKDYPLTIVINPAEQEKVWIGVREDSPQVSNDEGEALFNGMEETEFLTQRKNSLIQHFEEDQATKAIMRYFADNELLVSQSLTVRVDGEVRTINGIYLIDEAKLNQMDDEAYLGLRKRGLIGPIYSHLTSLHQINRLAALQTGA